VSLAGAGETVDGLLRGRIRVVQSAHGPRVTTDPLLLADFVVRSCRVHARTACDLGSGSGVIALALAALDPQVRATGIELEPALVERARRGAVASSLTDRVTFACADLRTLPGARPGYDLVLANPPYHARGSGPTSSSPVQARAHHELACTLREVVGAAARIAAPRGRFGVIYPAARLADLVAALGGARFGLRTLRLVHPRSGRPASRVLALAQQGFAGGCEVLHPLLLHDSAGWSPEAAAILEGNSAASPPPAC
jgi:tRNA1(Val) A37 N6-methylase TrmN6